MTSIAQLVQALRSRGVTIEPEGARLRVRPARAVTPAEVETLRRHKPEILVLLTESQEASSLRSLVTERATAFRTQVEAYWRHLGETWSRAKHLPIPPLSLPGVVAAPGTCELCGEALMPGHTYRCSPCVEAVNLMLAWLAERG